MNLQENIHRIKVVMGINEVLKDIHTNYPLYHFTPESSGVQILQSDSMRIGPKNNYISTTRNKNFDPFGKGLSDIDDEDDMGPNDFNIEFVFDKNLLRTKYRVIPYDSFGEKIHNSFNREESDRNEYEEKIDTNVIEPLHRYLVNVKYHGKNPEVEQFVNDYKVMFL
jgi:hypothetical protein